MPNVICHKFHALWRKGSDIKFDILAFHHCNKLCRHLEQWDLRFIIYNCIKIRYSYISRYAVTGMRPPQAAHNDLHPFLALWYNWQRRKTSFAVVYINIGEALNAIIAFKVNGATRPLLVFTFLESQLVKEIICSSKTPFRKGFVFQSSKLSI